MDLENILSAMEYKLQARIKDSAKGLQIATNNS